jgi:hypothetical protein
MRITEIIVEKKWYSNTNNGYSHRDYGPADVTTSTSDPYRNQTLWFRAGLFAKDNHIMKIGSIRYEGEYEQNRLYNLMRARHEQST